MTGQYRNIGLLGRTGLAVFAVSAAIIIVGPPAFGQTGPNGSATEDAADSIDSQPRSDSSDTPRRRARGPRKGAPPGLWHRMSERERKEVEAFMQEHFPRMFLELERVKSRSPERFEQRMKRIVHQTREMMELLTVHPERGSLRIQERQLDLEMRRQAKKYRSATNAEKREKIRRGFRELCAKAFECRHRRREIEIRELEARIAELNQRHAEAAEIRNKLIDREVDVRLLSPRSRKRN